MSNTTNKPARARRKHFQFGLRTLLVLWLAAGALLGWMGVEAKLILRQRAVATDIRRQGGQVSYDFYDRYGNEPYEITWLREKALDDCLSSISGATLYGFTDTDALMNRLAQFSTVTNLDLTASDISPVGLKQLRRMPNLEELSLGNLQVGRSESTEISRLARLKRLYLIECKIDPAAIAQLKAMDQLECLDVTSTGISPDMLAQLRAGLPKTEVVMSPMDEEEFGPETVDPSQPEATQVSVAAPAGKPVRAKKAARVS